MPKAARVERICKVCGKSFQVYFSRLKYSSCPYCSPACAILGRRRRVTKICPQCGQSFEVKRSHADSRTCCSAECRKKNDLAMTAAAMVPRICKVCGESFKCGPNQARIGTGRYCSHSCACIAIVPRQYVHQSDTSLERIVRDELQRRGLFFESQKRMGRYVVDFLLPFHEFIIEVDGDYWHKGPQTIEKDWNRDHWFLDQGYDVLRFYESVLLNYPKRCFDQLPAPRGKGISRSRGSK